MKRTGWIVLVAVSLVLFVTSAFVVNSSDPGVRGVVADVAFFGWLATVIVMIALGTRALAGRFRSDRGD
jgi:hypothetical protein